MKTVSKRLRNKVKTLIISRKNLKRRKISFSRRAISLLRKQKSVRRKTRRLGKDLPSLKIA